MIDNQPAGHTPARQLKKIPIHERSVRVGDVVVINAHRANHHLLKQRFAEGGYHLYETKHFLLFTRVEEPKIVLAHWFTPEELTTNIPGYLSEELKSFGVIRSNQQLGELFAGIVGGTLYPGDVRRAWNYKQLTVVQRATAALIERRGGIPPTSEEAGILPQKS